MTTFYDVAIAGGGPVGLFTAITAQRAGLTAIVIEPRSGSVDKACGEGLMPQALNALHEIGVDPPGHDFTGITYTQGKTSVAANFSGTVGRGVKRTELSTALVDRARELGIPFARERVTRVENNHDGVKVNDIRARYLIGADGLHSKVRELTGLSAPTTTHLPRYGLRQHFSVAPWSHNVEVYWLKDCEVYVTPVAESMVGVAVLGAQGLNLDAAIAHIPALKKHLEHAGATDSLMGAGPLRQTTTRRTAGRVLLVGDAAGYVDALTGEGLRVGFAESQVAISAVAAGNLEHYERDWRKVTRSYRLLTGGLLRASTSRVTRPFIVPLAKNVPGAFSKIVNSLAA